VNEIRPDWQAFNSLIHLEANWERSRRRQWIELWASTLGERFTIVAVQPPLDLVFSPWQRFWQFREWSVRRPLVKLAPNLYLYTPSIPIDFKALKPESFLYRLTQRWLGRQFKGLWRSLDRADQSCFELIFATPQLPQTGLFPQTKGMIYDPLDSMPDESLSDRAKVQIDAPSSPEELMALFEQLQAILK